MEKIVVFTGAGVSGESGLKTFRDMGGLWHEYAIEDVASPEGWNRNASAVLAFYNERRTSVLAAQPNSAHEAIARLELKFEVIVITQNIDDLHERAGSSNVIHVHGEILKARSSVDSSLVYELNKPTIELGELCEKGSQLRPDVVWFGENVQQMEACLEHFATASRVITVGTSLTVYPAAGLVKKAPFSAEKYLISPEAQKVPYGFRFLRGQATTVVPHVVTCWLAGRKPV
ncbi:SIR2 family NAD-dependent protein deacylase [Dyella tabacisoli]|uniref:protein acetyllysine N-acetyltransferase n=1 Tax=Dyella tabacisoli TaxID=2282381 RepID=A0A369UHM9_9GAMM|nr:Sir2 family NAD-dependent protein deacetylase [Dyella tabacisoli]RDD80056.1 NAD-dependent deacylase [Dyella tabacisoli]